MAKKAKKGVVAEATAPAAIAGQGNPGVMAAMAGAVPVPAPAGIDALMAAAGVAAAAVVEKKKGSAKTPEVKFPTAELKKKAQDYIAEDLKAKAADAAKKTLGADLRPMGDEQLAKFCRDNAAFHKTISFEGILSFGQRKLSIVDSVNPEQEKLAKEIFGQAFEKYFELKDTLPTITVKPACVNDMGKIGMLIRLCDHQATAADKAAPHFKEMFDYFVAKPELCLKRIGEATLAIVSLEHDAVMDSKVGSMVKMACDQRLLSYNDGTLKSLQDGIAAAGVARH